MFDVDSLEEQGLAVCRAVEACEGDNFEEMEEDKGDDDGVQGIDGVFPCCLNIRAKQFQFYQAAYSTRTGLHRL